MIEFKDAAIREALGDLSDGRISDAEVTEAARDVALALQHEAQTHRIQGILALALEAMKDVGKREAVAAVARSKPNRSRRER